VIGGPVGYQAAPCWQSRCATFGAVCARSSLNEKLNDMHIRGRFVGGHCGSVGSAAHVVFAVAALRDIAFHEN